MPNTVLDMRNCPLFFEDPIEVIDGDCGMTRAGCPYVREDKKEKWLDDGLLVWRGGEELEGMGGVGRGASSGSRTEIERKVLEDRTEERRKTTENRILARGEVPMRKAISLNSDNRGNEKPKRNLTTPRDKALPPPPGEPVSPEPIEGLDPRVVFKMIPDFHH